MVRTFLLIKINCDLPNCAASALQFSSVQVWMYIISWQSLYIALQKSSLSLPSALVNPHHSASPTFSALYGPLVASLPSFNELYMAWATDGRHVVSSLPIELLTRQLKKPHTPRPLLMYYLSNISFTVVLRANIVYNRQIKLIIIHTCLRNRQTGKQKQTKQRGNAAFSAFTPQRPHRHNLVNSGIYNRGMHALHCIALHVREFGCARGTTASPAHFKCHPTLK